MDISIKEMLTLLAILAGAGIIVHFVRSYAPMDPAFKFLISAVVFLFVVFYLINFFF